MALEPFPRQRLRTIFSGRVQGVGFRFTVQELARARPLTGYVRNLPDGDVELVAEGAPADLEYLLDAIAGSRLDRYIVGRDIQRGPARGDFADFCIRC